jgi:2-polyprenyl-3-methyl-5-hydroxy-6-metoxy-1,4-benzoquinol methylase
MGGDRERWNARWREQAGELAPPAAFLVEHTGILPRTGRALDIAGGAGRHAVWLARAGLDVTMVDVSDVAIERAERRAIAAQVAKRVRFRWVDLTDPGPAGELPPGPFDVIVMFHYLDRARRDAIADLLSVGGLVIACQPTVRNLEQHARPSRDYLVAEGELEAWATGLDLEIVVAREGWNAEHRHEAELIARRRAPVTEDPPRVDPGASSGPYR